MNTDSFLQRHYGVITFCFAGILIIPQLYYLSNIENFSFDLLLVIFPVLLSLGILFLGVILPLANKIQLALAGFGLSILICDQFLRLDLGFLDGSNKQITIPFILSAANLLIYLGLPIIFILFGHKFKKLLVDLAFIFILLGISLTFYSIYSSLDRDNSHLSNMQLNHYLDKTASTKNEQSSVKRANVYFLWLDAMETGYMQKYLESEDIDGTFSGFTLFENNSANYLYTTQSYPSFMSGTLFKEGNYLQWRKGSDRLRKDLASLGYRSTFYTKKDFSPPLSDVSYTSDALFKKWTSVEHPFVKDFISYWLVRSLPSILANQSLKLGRIIGEKTFPFFNYNASFSHVQSITDGIEPLSGVFTLKQLILDEKFRQNNNEFVTAQAIIPHGPYVIDKNCEYRGPASNPPKKLYYQQVICSANLVKRFLKLLKDLKRFDSSLIIIMGDHGSGWAGPVNGLNDNTPALNKKFTPWNKSQLISRSSPLLMIKRPNKHANLALVISQKESQLIDIYPTILSVLGESSKIPSAIDGINLFSPEIISREKYITYFKPNEILNLYEADIYDLSYGQAGGINDISYRSSFNNIKNMKKLSCHQAINFSSGSYLSSGLSGAESWGKWSNSSTVEIKVKLQKEVCKPSQVSFLLRAFVTNKHPVQSASVFLNNIELGEINIRHGEKQPQRLTFNITEKAFKEDDVNIFRFEINHPMSPHSLGLGKDTRSLGIGFHSMNFSP